VFKVFKVYEVFKEGGRSQNPGGRQLFKDIALPQGLV